ncbi:23S rRNA (adenine(1618)-N(6))-methyltransferase RlmF [Zobellia galactanivorans]|uniref:23S rRNA (adenine(1618)-N(6))-methyltransferase RlmF n=1 Tax=Zobellia galactanivorans (strain DSM 12802 / CCUG 47099 / CIP 106680 / NCIMB 13871 / Dsij) TaxID=63186 RepID=UPI001C076BE5|nr:23S rRNA (adenine(1618)-N(6))-methyltransferase RlmF [Zobellia galactanivorans]MBU3025684.1 23S rRNA (adenine(1618)-N(6))-methyltransferase RlmF [Zobellia galactanivorans]MDO6808164.1 23S rRNA (adenine(1618)-N(6))-methyltransferase RlmF [Zobellia galactanivorans]
MSSEKKPKEKARLHVRNKNRERYDLEALKTVQPELKGFIKPNKFGVESIDFSNPRAVKLLNKALLNHYYGIENWEFPDENLCPPIPGRADYIHHIADVLGDTNAGNVPSGNKITCLEIGVGASCIYPIIGVTEYGWNFIGSDIDPKSIVSAKHIVNSNPSLKGKVECRLQKSARDIFRGILSPDEKIDLVICNPPFHSSMEEAQKGSRRKIKNLSGKKVKTPKLNFSGIGNELIYDGGEARFIENMIWESRKFNKNCYLFSTLVSKESNLRRIYKLLEKVEAHSIKTIPMGTGNKSSRIIAWTFFSEEAQKEWVASRW